MKLNIAILGTRGIPNNYGGFEHIAGCLARGLVERGHAVTVYNPSNHPYKKNEWHGVHITCCYDPEFLLGIAGQFFYDLNCIRDARRKKYDIILMLGYTSSSVWRALYPKNVVIITNMDGLEWKRTKYSKLVKRFIKYAERLAAGAGNFHIADSPVIKQYLDEEYGISSHYIPYGACLCPQADEDVLAGYGLEKHKYLMLMARMEPENNIEMILDGYCRSKSSMKFLVVGNTGNHFGRYLTGKYKMQEKIVFAGGIYNANEVQSIRAYCSLYFHGHSVGGTNPSLLDAMAAKVPIAAHDNAFNRYILKQNALFFSTAAAVSHLICAGAYHNNSFLDNNYATVENEFTWPLIVEQYEDFFTACVFANRGVNHHRMNK